MRYRDSIEAWIHLHVCTALIGENIWPNLDAYTFHPIYEVTDLYSCS